MYQLIFWIIDLYLLSMNTSFSPKMYSITPPLNRHTLLRIITTLLGQPEPRKCTPVAKCCWNTFVQWRRAGALSPTQCLQTLVQVQSLRCLSVTGHAKESHRITHGPSQYQNFSLIVTNHEQIPGKSRRAKSGVKSAWPGKDGGSSWELVRVTWLLSLEVHRVQTAGLTSFYWSFHMQGSFCSRGSLKGVMVWLLTLTSTLSLSSSQVADLLHVGSLAFPFMSAVSNLMSLVMGKKMQGASKSLIPPTPTTTTTQPRMCTVALTLPAFLTQSVRCWLGLWKDYCSLTAPNISLVYQVTAV